MGKTSFNNTSDLIKNLSEKISDLNNGKLSLTELDALVSDSQSLYEQLIILRFKAFDKFGEPRAEIPAVKTQPIEIIPDLPPVEVKETVEIPFDFSEIVSNTPPTQQEIEVKVEESVPTTSSPKEVNIPKVDKVVMEDEEEENDSNSLNDKLKKEEDQSLRKIFQNSPISDIKGQISIAKKFEYISSMFKGNGAEYEEAIDFLNNAANGKEAKLKLNDLTEKYQWDLEDKSIIKFIELVERRYI